MKFKPFLKIFLFKKNRKEMPEIKKIKLHVFLNLATNFF